MNNIGMEEKKTEALGRMKMLSIFTPTIQQFNELGKISVSEPPFGAFYWIEGEDLGRVRKFEREYDALVYTVIRSFTDVGVMDSFLFVSDYLEEWKDDRELLKEGEALAYVYNHDMSDCSEIGHIGIERTVAAGLRWTW